MTAQVTSDGTDQSCPGPVGAGLFSTAVIAGYLFNLQINNSTNLLVEG